MTFASDHQVNDTVADADIIARASDLRSLLQREAPLGEERRNITDATVAALHDAGMFRVGKAKRWGGFQAGLSTTMRTIAEVARGDGAAGWITMILGCDTFVVSLFTERAQAEVWGDNPDALVSGVFSPSATAVKVDGGYVVNGRWAFNSGCLHAAWAMLAFQAPADNGDQPKLRIALIPTTDLTIEDTWHVAGMCGTGSNTSVGQDVFVPEYRTILHESLYLGVTRSDHPEDQDRARLTSGALILAIVSPLLGLGSAAVDSARATLDQGRPVVGSVYQAAIDSPSYQLNYASAVSKVDTAYMHALRSAGDVDASVSSQTPLDQVTQGRIRMDIGVAIRNLREAVALSMDICGAGGFATAKASSRVWRDFETGSRHALLSPSIGHEDYARALLNRNAPTPNSSEPVGS